jgi:hypothetical protein
MSFFSRQRRVGWFVAALAICPCWVNGQPLRIPDPTAAFDEYARVLCGDLSLEESVGLIEFQDTPESFRRAFNLSQDGEYLAALTALQNMPQPGKGSPSWPFSYWELLGYLQGHVGEVENARQSIRELMNLGDTEQARIDIAAWRFLRELGEEPTRHERDRILGAVVLVNLSGYRMVVSGYADGNARISADNGMKLLANKEWLPEQIQKAATNLTQVPEDILRVAQHGDCLPPDADDVKFALLTPGGIRTRVEKVADVARSDHPLHGFWARSNGLFASLLEFYQRLAHEQPKRR